jgi:hypothetical protein
VLHVTDENAPRIKDNSTGKLRLILADIPDAIRIEERTVLTLLCISDRLFRFESVGGDSVVEQLHDARGRIMVSLPGGNW